MPHQDAFDSLLTMPKAEQKSFDEFLNPKSMITPGAAGSMTMLIANTLYTQFNIEPKWSGLTISFIFAFFVVSRLRMIVWQRALLLFLNGMIVFSVAIGTTTVFAKSNTSNNATAGYVISTNTVPSHAITNLAVALKTNAHLQDWKISTNQGSIVLEKKPAFFSHWLAERKFITSVEPSNALHKIIEAEHR